MILTDRSRHFRGLKDCARARFHEYHQYGFGIRPRSESIPLATGTAIHQAVEPMLVIGKERLATRDEARIAIAAAVETYKHKCEARGFQGEDSDSVAYVIAEQSTLIAGLAWSFYRVLLPWLLDEFEILEVEREVDIVLGCTCGLGDRIAGIPEHESRACQGVALMSRGDLICRRRSDGTVGAWDLKSTGYGFSSNEHEHSVQMALSSIAAEKIIGERCTHSYLIGFLKGKRDFQTKAEREAQGSLKKQQSLLCYAWYKPADPPFGGEDWRFEYTREKGYGKVPIWTAGQGFGEPLVAAEVWVMEVLPEEKVREQLSLYGPMQRQEWLEPAILREIELEARKWDTAQIDEFPRSFDCYPWGRACEFLSCCFDPALGDPLSSGRYLRRSPHHVAEAQVAKAAGWVGESEEVEE